MTAEALIDTFRAQITPRSGSKDSIYTEVLVGLLEAYFTRVPDAQRIFELISERGDTVKNDHIAFRSLDLRPLLKLFMHFDYSVHFEDNAGRVPFNFNAPNKKLTAVWLKHPNPDMPRVFVSEIRIEDLHSEEVDIPSIVGKYTSQQKNLIDTLDLDDAEAISNYLHTGLWPTPTFKEYEAIGSVSEYLAWVLYNEYYLNHFTLTINALSSFGYKDNLSKVIREHQASDTDTEHYFAALHQTYNNIMNDFNAYLKASGFTLNTVGGKDLNISPDNALLQSSTKANPISAAFPDGTYSIPGSYVEFAYRGLLPSAALQLRRGDLSIEEITDAHLRDGFEAGNANNIFDSTSLKDTDALENKGVAESIETPDNDAFLKSRERILAYIDSGCTLPIA